MSNNFVLLIDFDGTITHQDTTTTVGRVVDEVYTNQKVTELKQEKITIKEYMTLVFKNLKLSEEQFYEVLADNITLDSYIREFIQEFPEFYIVSSGTDKNILLTLESHGIKLDPSTIVANTLVFNPEGLEYRLHEFNSDNGLDKVKVIQTIRQKHPDKSIYFIGDGISDIEAAHEADFVFSRKNKTLSHYCKEKSIEHFDYETFKDIVEYLNSLS